MSDVIVAAFVSFERAHRNASDSLEQGQKRPAEVRARLIKEAGPAFKKLDAKARKAFADSLLSNQLLKISAEQIVKTLEKEDFAILLPLKKLDFLLAYVRHVRKRGLEAVAQAAQLSHAA